MQEWTTGVKTGIAAVILVIIIALVFGVIYNSMMHIDDGTDKINTAVSSYKDTEFVKYDNTIVSGNDVINAIGFYKDICILVKYPSDASYCMAFNKGIDDSLWDNSGKYLSGDLPDTAALNDMTSSLKVNNSADQAGYINPAARFEAFLLKNESGAVIGLKFSHL
ncbi:MAG: hypothetical protein IJ583_00625 [Firmicutes bacterium]|nr:hypothetical protein [Bacillota bacterium]